MKKILQLITLVVLSTFISSCILAQNTIYNLPTEGIMPRLAKKNDLDYSVSFSNKLLDRGNDNYGNIQIGYSPIKHLGINIGHFSFREVNFNEVQLTHFSLGGYVHLQSNKIKKIQESISYPKWRMPLGLLLDYYVGIEFGGIKNYANIINNNNPTPQSSNFRIEKKFVRGGLHYQGKLIGLSHIFKVGLLTYKKGSIDLGGETSSIFYTNFQKIINDNSERFLEQTTKLFIGKKAIQGYLGFSLLLPQEGVNSTKKHEIYFIGVHADLDYLYLRKKN